MRSVLLAESGFERASASDLEHALDRGLSDPLVVRAGLARHGEASRRAELAYILLGLGRASDDQVEAAALALFSEGTGVVQCGHRSGNRIAGWVASIGAGSPSLRVRSDAEGPVDVPLRPGKPFGGAPQIRRFSFDFAPRSAGSVTLEAAVGGVAARSLVLYPGAAADLPRARDRWRPGQGSAPRVTVLLPVYSDPHSLSDCLDALRRQRMPRLSFVVVDDASPDPEVERLARRFCRDVGGVYRRNAVNSGFAAAINLGLSLCRSGDVLLLNSDVILPDGAMERLHRAAWAEDDTGIVAPFSNDAGNTTFPDPLMPGPPVPKHLAAQIDAAAQRVNARRTVDLLSVMGSCLYVKRACLDRIGPLSLAYGRGYYEDIDLCLKARQHGFRVAGACDIYVSHVSGRSFGRQRHGLVARNQSVIESRFPGYGVADACFDRAVPMRRARAAIEEELTPSAAPCVLLVGRRSTAGALMDRRIGMLDDDASFVLSLDWSLAGNAVELALSSRAASGPRSLAFALDADGRARLGRYLSRLDVARVELFEPHLLPDDLRRWIAEAGFPLALVVDGPKAAAAAGGATPGRIGAPLRMPGAGPIATDRMAAACLPEGVEVWSPARPEGGTRRDGSPSRLGVLMAELCPEAESLVLALGRRLRRLEGIRLIVLGRCIDDAQVMSPGASWVSGPVGLDEMPEVIEHYGIGALLLPHRGSCFWRLDHLPPRVRRPSAYFDWSPRGLPAGEDDLALDPTATEDEVCADVIRWCGALARLDGRAA